MPCKFRMADIPKILFTFWQFSSILVAAFTLLFPFIVVFIVVIEEDFCNE